MREGAGKRRWKRRVGVFFLLLFLVIAAKGFALECPVSVNTSYDSLYPDISGDRIVWEGAGDIYLFDIADGNETKLTADAIAQSSPVISGSLVAWNEGDSILLQDLSTSNLPATLTTYGNSPAISGNRVALVNITEDVFFPNISVYDAGTDTLTDVITEPYDRPNGGQPAISGDRLVWVNGTDLTAIYQKDFVTGAEELVNESLCGNTFASGGYGCIANPAVSGDRIVWSGFRDDTWNQDIFVRDPANPMGTAVSTNDGLYFNPAIDGTRIVWTDYTNIFYDDISDADPPVTLSSLGPSSGPRLSGNRVVWYEDVGGKKDIYLSTIGSTDPCPSVSFSAAPEWGVRDLEVQFTDTSPTNDTHSHWLWDFGDGTVSYEKDPRHNYTADGTYSVSLTASNEVGRGYASSPGLIRVGSIPVASFSADRTYGIVPLTVRFTDTSSGSPDSWAWDLNGDGLSESTLQNPSYTYSIPGVYNVNFSANNTFGPPGTINITGYIRALNGTSLTSNTVIAGLDITTAGGMQQITVDTGRIGSTFNPAENSSWLILSPPAPSGWERMDFYSMDGIGFNESGGLIRGNVTSCILESRDLLPTTFGTGIGNNLPVSYLLYLSAYPVNARIDATVWEGAIPGDDAAFRKTLAETSRDFTSILGTAYTLDFVTRNLVGVQSAALNLSVSSAWVQQYGNQNNIAVLRLGDDLVNETLNPSATFTDPAANLDFFTVPSPRGLSRFGLVSAAGSSNLIQIGARVASQMIQSSGGGYTASPPPATPKSTPRPTQAPTERPPVIYYGEGKVDTTPTGITRGSVIIKSLDWGAGLAIGAGAEAFDGSREPLTLVTVRPTDVASLPPIPEEAGIRFAGIAYDVGPDGATFNPPATLSLTVPDSQWDGNTRYLIRTYETGSGSWEEIPTEVDPSSRVVSGPVSHLCLFGLFAGEVLPPTPAPTARLPAADLQAQPGPVMRTPMGIFTGMVSWVYAAALANLPVALTFILVSLGAIYASTRRWWLTRYRTWITLYLISLTGLLWALFLSTSGGPFWESAWIVITVAGLNLIVHVLRFDRIDLSRRRYVEIGYR